MSYRTHVTVNSILRAILKHGSQAGLGLSALTPVLALANPTGGTVIAGTATITNPNANGTVVKETSAAAIIDWQQFNIGKGQYVQFLQPSSSSIILNRVIGGGGSSIYGSLTGNGQIFLVNTNGVFFGKGSSIDAQGFLASTLDISDSDFLARNFVFDKSGSDATVINQGSITAHKGGYVVLAGDYTENDGIIAAQSGHIILASGTKSTLTLNGNSLVSFAVNQATLAQLAGVTNAGKLEANGGTVIMTADVANLLKATVVNNTGLIEATSLSNQGGVIQLLATGGNISNAGTLDVAATRAGQQGGSITLKGDEKTLLTDASKIIATGDGADGGKVEVSGETLSMRGSLTLGKGGRLLLDPNAIEIVASASGTAGSVALGKGVAPSSGTGVTKLGVGFIQAQLDKGAAVAISADNFILASNDVHSIAATGNGDLSFKVGTSGSVRLGLTSINIGGKLTASFHSGSFGRIQAGSVGLHTFGGGMNLGSLVYGSHGGIKDWSVTATNGDITIVADHVDAGARFLGLKATGAISISGLAASDVVNINSTAVLVGKSVHIANPLAGSQMQLSISAGSGGVQMGAAELRYLAVKSAGGITAGRIQTDSGGVFLTATGGDIKVGSVTTPHGIIINAGAHDFSASTGGLAGGSATFIGSTVSLTAQTIHYHGAGAFQIDGGGRNVTVDGLFSDAGGSLQHGLKITTTGTITLDHSIKAQSISLTGAQLAYSGKNATFTLSAASGGVTLDAPIGSAKAPVKYAVNLDATGGELQVHRSIYSAKAIDITQAGSSVSGGIGAYVGADDGTAVTLSAKGPISITGALVGVGFANSNGGSLTSANAAVVISADDGNAKTMTDILSLTATGGNVLVHGGAGSDFNGSAAKLSQDRSVTLHAGADVVLTGNKVHLTVGDESASVGSAGAALSVKNSVSVTAGRDILIDATADALLSGGSEIGAALGGSKTESLTLTGGVSLVAGRDISIEAKSVHLEAGAADAKAQAAATVVATAGVNLSAGSNVLLQASASSFVEILGGDAQVKAVTLAAKQKTSATASADATIKAGHDLTATGHGINIFGGDSPAGGAQVLAAQSGAKAAAVAHADVALSAGDAISVTAETIEVNGGSGAGGAHANIVGNSNSQQVTWDLPVVSATGKGAAAALTATADVSLSAGAGGITLSATNGNLNMSGGNGAALAVQVDAGSLGDKASVDAEAKLTLKATGAVDLSANQILRVRGGASAAGMAQSFSSTHHGLSTFSRTVTGSNFAGIHAGTGGTANLKTDVSVSITAGGALTLTDTNATSQEQIIVVGGVRPAQGLAESATGAKAVTATAIDTAVSLSAGKGGISIKTDTSGFGSVLLFGGAVSSHASITGRASVANGAFLSATKGGKSGLTLDSRVILSATGAVSLQAQTAVGMAGGQNGLHSAVFQAGSNASVAASVLDGVSVTAGAAFIASAGGVHLVGGEKEAESVTVSAEGIGAKAALKADASISITAGTTLDIKADSAFGAELSGGVSAAKDARLTAVQGTASLTVSTGLSLAGAKGVLLSDAINLGGDLSLHAGDRAASGASIFGSDGGKAAVDAVSGISVTATAGAVSFTAHAGRLELSGASYGGNAAAVDGSHGGSATLAANGAVNVKAKTKFGVNVAGNLVVHGGGYDGSGAGVTASEGGAKAGLTLNDSIGITAASASMQAGAAASFMVGSFGARSVRVTAVHGATAAFKNVSQVDLAIAKNLTLQAGDGIDLKPGAFADAIQDRLKATGPKAVTGFTVDDALIMQAGGNLSLKVGANTNVLAVGGVNAAGDSMHASASGGGAIQAALQEQLTLAAKGALSLGAGSISVVTDYGPGDSDRLKALEGNAKVGLDIDADMALSGASVTITGTQGVVLAVRARTASHQVLDGDGSKSAITDTVNDDLSITATGALSVTAGAGRDLSIGKDATLTNGVGSLTQLTADLGATVDADLTANTTLKGASVTLTAGTAVVDAGAKAGEHVTMNVDDAAGNLTAERNVNVQASGALTVDGTLLVDYAGNSTSVHGGALTGASDHFTTNGSIAKATFTAQAEANLSGGTITQNGASFQVWGGKQTAQSLVANEDGGTFTYSADSRVTIAAKTNLSVTENGGSHGMYLRASGDFAASNSGDNAAGKATFAVASGIAVTAGKNLSINLNGAQLTVFDSGNVHGPSAGTSHEFFTSAKGVTQYDVVGNVTVKAGGQLGLTDISLIAAGVQGPTTPLWLIAGNDGKASGIVDESVSILGKTISISGGTPTSSAFGGSSFTANGVTVEAKLHFSAGIPLSFAPQGVRLGTLQQSGLILNLETVLAAPVQAGESTLFMPAASPQAGAAGCDATLVKQDGRCMLQY